ncbi:MAG: hypothetical protein EOO59_12115 [Hymenobacter sp.]|nr:MAG: hypothetical protein EOO59_12115 [Hymenobacter sp.]
MRGLRAHAGGGPRPAQPGRSGSGRQLVAHQPPGGGGLLGFGQAHTEARYEHDYPLFSSPYLQRKNFQFDARYLKYSGEAFVTWQLGRATSLGLAYRLVQLRLNDVTDQGTPVMAAPILRHEPMLYFRLRPPQANGLVQFQVAMGLSSTAGFNDRLPYDHDDPVAQFQVARSYVSLGLAFYPHVLWQRRGD